MKQKWNKVIAGAEAAAKKWLIVRTGTSEAALEIGKGTLEDLAKAVPQGDKIISLEYAAQKLQGSKTYTAIGKCGRDCSQCDCKKYKSPP